MTTCSSAASSFTAPRGRWICDGLVPVPITCRLAEQLATARDLDALHVGLCHVEHAFIHCRIDTDQVLALRSLHGRTWREIFTRDVAVRPLIRSARMLVRS